MKVTRRFTHAGTDPYESIKFVERSSEIRNPDGSLVFSMDGVMAPEGWSQVAVDVLVQKYFRKAGVPLTDGDGEPILDDNGEPVTGSETDARQVFDRLAGCWTHWGREYGYFDSDTCWRPRSRPPTRHNGSTPGFIGPTESAGPHRGTGMQTR
jgi:ribonucleoside-diphosphate reductase alpha chain